VISLLGIYLNEVKSGYNRDTYTLMLITAVFTVAKLWKQIRCPKSDDWINKMWYIYLMEFYSAVRNNDIWFEGKWIQLEDIMLSEISQTQKDKG
jgi:hypothetical protein